VEWLLTAIGLLGGLALSFLLWWVLARVMVPRVAFGTHISKLPDGDDRHVRYRVKIANVGRRDIIDLSVRVRLYMPASGSTSTNIVELPLNTDHLFILRPKDVRIFNLNLGEVESRFLANHEAALLKQRCDQSLERILNDHCRSFLLVQLLAYDGWSGARRYYRSERYRRDSIRPGRFKGLVVGTANIRPTPADGPSDGEEQVR
jgi:hypothetical protein